MDAKGRFLIPGKLKDQLPTDQQTAYVVNRGADGCLTMYPLATWEPLQKQIAELNDFDPKVIQFQRWFLNGATKVEPDSAGRLLLPKTLMDYAGLQKDIVLQCRNNKIEIWDNSKYKQLFEAFSPDAYKALAAEVMVTKNSAM
jgi:MraZ protein